MAALATLIASGACAESEGQTARAVPSESGCALIAVVKGKTKVIGPFSDLRVLNGPERLPIVVTPGGKLVGISCDRNSVVPDIRDDRIPRLLGIPLYLNQAKPDATARLELAANGFSITLVNGRWTADDERQILERLNLFNSRPRKP